MAINFPDNPSNGNTHVVGDVTFTYNSTKTLWVPSTAAATIHDTPVDGSSTIAISSNWAFDSVKTNVPTGALFTDTDTTYTAGTGLTLSTTQFNVDVGTTASKIIQLDGSAKLPAVDGSLLTNLPAGGATDIDGLSDGHYNSTSLSVGLGSGALAVEDVTGGRWNTAVGYQTLYTNSTGYDNTASGYQALYSNTTGNGNTANGWGVLFTNSTGSWNTASGHSALTNNSTGNYNTATGHQALKSNTTGGSNVSAGYRALYLNTIGDGNTASGSEALEDNTTGDYNTATGAWSLYNNTTGTGNTASGVNALSTNTTGHSNTATGRSALTFNNTGFQNTAVGTNALYLNTTGTLNIGIGFTAGDAIINGSNNTIIGDLPGTTSLADTVLIGAGTTERIKVDASGLSINGAAFTGGGSSVDIQDTPPTSASDGDLWINSTSMKLNVYYTDTNSSQWVETNTAGSNNYVDGVSLGGSTLTLTRSGTLPNLTADLSSLSGDYVDSAVFNNTTRDLTIGRTGSLADLTVNIPSATNTSAINEVEYTATAGQTVFSMTYDSTEDTLTLYINGVKQVSSSYTAVTGTSNNVTLNSGASLNDEVTIVVVSTLFVNEQIVGKSGNNGQASIPAGTTAQRTTGATGNLRFNTDDTNLEVYDSAAWRSVLQSGTNFEYEKIHPKSVTQTNTVIDMDNNNIYYPMSGHTTFTVTNYSSNYGRTTILHLDRNTVNNPTFPAVIKWAGGIEPTWSDHRDWVINLFVGTASAIFGSATGYDR